MTALTDSEALLAQDAALVQRTRDRIEAVLSPDLLHPRYRLIRVSGGPRAQKVFGHCYAASEALHYALRARGIVTAPHCATAPVGTHWWLVSLVHGVIDVTAAQFDRPTREAIYAAGRGKGFLTDYPSRRARDIIRRAGL